MWRSPIPLAVVAAVACGDAMPPEPARPRSLVTCVPSLDVRVDTQGGPRISWSPACGATYLEVSSPDNLETYWIIRGDTGKIAPGVTYGVTPPDYNSRFGPVPLAVGQWYAVRVGVMVDEDSYALVGEGVFQR